MKVLENKAQTITQALLDVGHISDAAFQMVYSIVLTQLREGGDYKLSEDKSSIHVHCQQRSIDSPARWMERS